MCFIGYIFYGGSDSLYVYIEDIVDFQGSVDISYLLE